MKNVINLAICFNRICFNPIHNFLSHKLLSCDQIYLDDCMMWCQLLAQINLIHCVLIWLFFFSATKSSVILVLRSNRSFIYKSNDKNRIIKKSKWIHKWQIKSNKETKTTEPRMPTTIYVYRCLLELQKWDPPQNCGFRRYWYRFTIQLNIEIKFKWAYGFWNN